MQNLSNYKRKQSGVVLVVSLIMLLLLTLMGVTGMQVTTLEEKMAGNARDQNIAFQAAEATLIEAEKFILHPTTIPTTFTGSGPFLNVGADDSGGYYFNPNNWTSANSAATTNFGEKFVNNNGSFIPDPRYIIKSLGLVPPSPSPPTTVYKITVRAQGINPGTQVVLQEFFERTN